MNLIELNINQILLIDKYSFQNLSNNIDYLNLQATLVENLDEKLALLTKAAEKIERFHCFFHFEQSYFHLKLAILYSNEGDNEKMRQQLELAIFQDRINNQAKSMIEGFSAEQVYQRPYNNFSDYLSYATDEKVEDFELQGYWQLSQDSIEAIEDIIGEIRKHHLNYHEEAAKLYLNRALIFHLLKQEVLAKNDIVKAHNLDNKLSQKEYYYMIMLQIGTEVVLGLGSNLGDRNYYLQQAVAKLQELNIITNIITSSVIESKADLMPDSPKEWDLDFLNMAIKGTTMLTPEQLLKAVSDVEQIIGKKAAFVWSPREIDIDILAYGNEFIKQENLQIPHARLLERLWAMVPFAEIWPDWIHPVVNKSIKEVYDEKIKVSRNS